MTCRVVVVRWGLLSTFNPWTGSRIVVGTIKDQTNLNKCCQLMERMFGIGVRRSLVLYVFLTFWNNNVDIMFAMSRTWTELAFQNKQTRHPFFWTWNNASLAAKKLQRTRTSIEMVKEGCETYILFPALLPITFTFFEWSSYFLTNIHSHILTFFRTSYWHEPQILSGILSDTLSDILSDRSSAFCLTFFLTEFLTVFLTFFFLTHFAVKVRRGTLAL